jgi:hypothetical protein
VELADPLVGLRERGMIAGTAGAFFRPRAVEERWEHPPQCGDPLGGLDRHPPATLVPS